MWWNNIGRSIQYAAHEPLYECFTLFCFLWMACAGIVRQPLTKSDEIHNCQMVIDVLSADVIKDNLSHIRGVDIVEGKIQSVNNLLDIFCFLYEYVIKQIESDVPTDTDADGECHLLQPCLCSTETFTEYLSKISFDHVIRIDGQTHFRMSY
jgi:hypothetical protein